MDLSMMLMFVFFSFSIFSSLEPISDSAHTLGGIDDAMDQLDEIYYAVLEENGKLSVFPRAADAPLKSKDMSLTVDECGIDHLLVIDGKILPSRLSELGWDEERLDCEIKRTNVPLDEIFIMAADDSGKITCIRKEKKK